MTRGNPSSSQVVPVLVAVLVCDVACTDPSTGKHSLIGLFDRIHVSNFPAERPMSLYFKLTDAEGRYELDAKFVQVGSGKTLATAKSTFNVADRLVSAQFHVPFPPLKIPSPGRYEFQIWTNSVFLGATFMDVVQRGG